MLTSQFNLKDAVVRLQNLEKQIKENTDLDSMRSKFYGICYDMLFASEENYFTLNDFKYKQISGTVESIMKSSASITDAIEFKNGITTILNFFDEERNYSNLTMDQFSSGPHRGATRYEHIEENNLTQIIKCIESNRNLNLLDPRCRDGINLGIIKRELDESCAYGIEQESHLADRAKTTIDRVAKGSLLGSRISNEVFDVMFLEPPISWVYGESFKMFVKQEKRYLQSTMKYLRTDGVFIMIIPYFRMQKDMCMHMARYFKNVQVRKLAGRDFLDKGLIAIIGQKNSSRDVNEETYNKLRRLYNSDKIADVFSEPLDKYILPKNEEAIELFRGSILDMDEMDAIVKSSGCMDVFWESQEIENLSKNSKQPLLPFNIGQLGLVLTSGCLDGLIDEGNGYSHVIKGRVSKKSDVERDVTNAGSNLEVQETISNRVEINVILPNGEYKILA